MDEKLTKEQKERLLALFKSVLENDAFTQGDMAKQIDLLLEVCEREKALTEETLLLERFKKE